MTSTASGAGRGVAVLVAAGGLVATIALPASAAPEAAPAAAPATVSTAVDSAFGTAAPAVVSAPAAATTVTTAATFTAVPTPAPVVVVPAVIVKAAPAVAVKRSAVAVKRSARAAVASPKVAAVVPDAAPAKTAAAQPAAVEVVTPAAAPAASGMGDRILDTASQYAGVPYVYGGTTPAGFDCSGYTGYVMRQNGVSLPRTANAQKSASTRIDRSQAVPGDLVFFTSGGRAYHVGIYAGGNKMWDAPRSGKPVQLRTIWTSAVTFGRVAPVA